LSEPTTTTVDVNGHPFELINHVFAGIKGIGTVCGCYRYCNRDLSEFNTTAAMFHGYCEYGPAVGGFGDDLDDLGFDQF
jgi:hypothetical protein